MKNIKKTYLLMILLLSLSVPGYACYPETIDDWSTWCEDNGISYNEYDTYEDYLANATDEQLDNWDGITNGHDAYGNMTGSIDNIYITAPIVNNNTNTSTVDPSTPFSDPDPDYDNNTPDPNPNDCAGVEGGSAYFDNCRECVGGTTGKEPCDCEGMRCPFCSGIIVPVDAPMRSPDMMRTASACPTCKCAVKTKLFLDKCAGYNYIWQMSHDANGNFIREVAGLVLEDKSVLIIPFENNVSDHAFTKVFTYVETATGGLGVKLNGKVYEIVQIVHSHPGEINPYNENPLGYSPDDDGWWARRLGHDIQIMMDGELYLVGDSSYANYYNLNQINSPCEQ